MDLLSLDNSKRKIRSALLLLALIALIVTAFVLPTAPGSTAAHVMKIVYIVVFSVASYLIGARHKWFFAYGILAVGVWVIALTDTFIPYDTPTLVLMRDILLALLQLMLVILVLRFSMFEPNANRVDRLVAGISGYLIIALLWAALYAIHERILPGGLVDSSKGGINGAEGDYLYYSLITLSTTGYGDIVPITPSARLLSSLQAVAGTLYLAVFIAALLGRNADELEKENHPRR